MKPKLLAVCFLAIAILMFYIAVGDYRVGRNVQATLWFIAGAMGLVNVIRQWRRVDKDHR